MDVPPLWALCTSPPPFQRAWYRGTVCDITNMNDIPDTWIVPDQVHMGVVPCIYNLWYVKFVSVN